VAYTHGALAFKDGHGTKTAVVTQTYDKVANYTVEKHFTFNPIVQTLIGGGVMAMLALARFRWTRWPLYPVGWLLASTYPMNCIWFSIFLGWLAKGTILKLGGAEMYERLKPLFVGLIIGDVIMGTLCSSLVFFAQMPPVSVMPG
ncbi:MAG: hypothetical protein QGD94_02330, partial [Planctomycetia bacterium]|nr:hypothetical protein [Planctomycetia bacterium]